MEQPSRCSGGMHGAWSSLCGRCQEQQELCFCAVLLSWSDITQADKANSFREPFTQAKGNITLTPEIWLWSELPCFLFSVLQEQGNGQPVRSVWDGKCRQFLRRRIQGSPPHPAQERDSGFLSPFSLVFSNPCNFILFFSFFSLKANQRIEVWIIDWENLQWLTVLVGISLTQEAWGCRGRWSEW